MSHAFLGILAGVIVALALAGALQTRHLADLDQHVSTLRLDLAATSNACADTQQRLDRLEQTHTALSMTLSAWTAPAPTPSAPALITRPRQPRPARRMFDR